jgi:heterodisulfide reductase subunit A-like polyferredoxin
MGALAGLKWRESALLWRRHSHGAYAQAIVAIGMVFAGPLVNTAGRIFHLKDVSMKTHARVAVIGGGVVGVSTLYHLARKGWSDVVLLER